MDYYGNNDFRDHYLSHHGILGMKWGKKNGPPYPLGSSDHSASEKKAGWRKSLGGGRNEEQYEKSHKISTPTKDDLRKYREEMIAKHDHDLARQQRYKNMTEEQLRERFEQRELAKKIILASTVTIGVGAGMYLAYKSGVINDIAKLGKGATPNAAKQIMKDHLDDIVLPKGQVFHRMTAEAGIDFSKTSEATYVAYKRKDVDKYMALLKDWKGTGERYDVTLRAIEDIRMPSKKRAKEIFEELWKNDPTYKDELKNTLIDAYEKLYKKQFEERAATAKKLGFPPVMMSDSAIRGLAEREAISSLNKSSFDSAIYSIVKRQGDSKKLLAEYAKHGYNAIEDYFDKGDFTDSPVILFNPSSTVVKTGEKKVTESMKRLAMMRLGYI